MGRKDGNTPRKTIRSIEKVKKRKDRKDLTQRNSRSYKSHGEIQPAETQAHGKKKKKKKVAAQRIARSEERAAALKDGKEKELGIKDISATIKSPETQQPTKGQDLMTASATEKVAAYSNAKAMRPQAKPDDPKRFHQPTS